MRIRRLLVLTLAVSLALAALGGSAYGVWRWATYPDVPDVKVASAEDAVAFMGTDDFNRMTESHRQRYAMAVVEKMRDKPLEELIAMMLKRDARRTAAAKNVRNLKGRDEIGGAMMRVFLDKFYEQPKVKRQGYLTMIAVAQQGQIGKNPERFGLPPADKLKKDWAKFMRKQPPRSQAQMGQFLIDLSKHREMMGLKEPF